jgi:helicase
MRRRGGVEPQIIALSGVIGETNGFERFLWDGRRQYLHAETGGVTTEDGPLVRPQFSGKNSSEDIIIPLVRRADLVTGAPREGVQPSDWRAAAM